MLFNTLKHHGYKRKNSLVHLTWNFIVVKFRFGIVTNSQYNKLRKKWKKGSIRSCNLPSYFSSFSLFNGFRSTCRHGLNVGLFIKKVINKENNETFLICDSGIFLWFKSIFVWNVRLWVIVIKQALFLSNEFAFATCIAHSIFETMYSFKQNISLWN